MKVINLLVLLIFLLSCKKEEDPVFPTLINISGTWRLNEGYRSLTFTKNHEFIDSLFSDYYDTISQINKGNFKFINGFIEIDDIKPIYLEKKNSLISSFDYSYKTFKFQIIDDILIMDETGILKPYGHNGYTLDGKWQANRNIIVYDSRQEPNFISGNQKIEFDFIKNTDTYFINYWNSYGINKDSLSDGPYIYRRDYQNIYCYLCNSAFGVIENNIFMVNGDHRTYRKIK